MCVNCSAPAHDECSLEAKCSNCELNHKSNDRKCPCFKLEEAALLKSEAEHISIGYARRLLRKSKSFADVVKSVSSQGKSTMPPRQNITRTNRDLNFLPLNHEKASGDLNILPLPSPSSSRMNSPRLSSRALSLPDFGEEHDTEELSEAPLSERIPLQESPLSSRKRGRPPSFSPPSTRDADIPPLSRYGNSFRNKVDCDNLVNSKVRVELHHPSTHQMSTFHSVKKKVFKPNISRPMLRNSSGSGSKPKTLQLRTAS